MEVIVNGAFTAAEQLRRERERSPISKVALSISRSLRHCDDIDAEPAVLSPCVAARRRGVAAAPTACKWAPGGRHNKCAGRLDS